MNTRKTKVVAKLADNKSEVPFIKSLLEVGMDVTWLNTAHQDEPQTLEVVKRIREVSEHLPILLDTKGPEVRTKNVTEPIPVKKGDIIYITGNLELTGEKLVHVTYPNFHAEMPKGEVILYDDASMSMIVEEVMADRIACRIENDATIKNKKSLNIPNVHIDLPALTAKDIGFVHFCAKNNIDFIIHSFVRNVADLNEIKDILKAYPNYHGKILAKIENREGFNNVAEILDNCEGIMVARGDLGAEVPMCELPYLQKKMVETAVEKGKYVIVATEVLNSMIKSPRPTRAEVNDIANAVIDRTDAMSMSGETAYGDYPVEATKMMGDTMAFTESKLHEFRAVQVKYKDEPHVHAVFDAVEAAFKDGAVAIVDLTNDYDFTKSLSACRPSLVICAPQSNVEYVRDLMLAYGVRPVFVENGADVRAAAKKHINSSLSLDAKVIIVEKKGSEFTTSIVAYQAL